MATTYLSRAVSTTGDRQKWTMSVWCKRSALADNSAFRIMTVRSGGEQEWVAFDQDDIHVSRYNNSYIYRYITNRKFRDINAWYHIVVAMDTTQATASNRMKLYVNGVQETSFSTETQISQNYNTVYNTSGFNNEIGWDGSSAGHFDGSMAHFHFIDGTAYDADTFGETDSTTGIWKPKTAPSVTYGTNGFFLKFENSGAFGTDSSGNANTFTVNGTMTQTIDTPSNVFATLNPLHFGTGGTSNTTLTNGNNTFTSTQGGSPYPYFFSTLGATEGKWYAEFKYSAGVSGDAATVGIGSVPDQYSGNNSLSWSYYANGNVYNGGSSSSYGNAWNVGSILGVAMDLDNSKLYFSINGTWQNSGDPTSGSTGTGAISVTANTLYLFEAGDAGGNQPTIQCNFGNGYFGTTAVASAQNPDDGIGIFEYDVPAGYRALCTKSINAEEYS